MTGGLKVCLSEFCLECECTIVKNFVKLKMFEDYKDLVSNVATVVTIVNFLTGSQVCYEFYKKGTTGAASCASFLVGVMMTFSWYSYGVLRSDHSIYAWNVRLYWNIHKLVLRLRLINVILIFSWTFFGLDIFFSFLINMSVVVASPNIECNMQFYF